MTASGIGKRLEGDLQGRLRSLGRSPEDGDNQGTTVGGSDCVAMNFS